MANRIFIIGLILFSCTTSNLEETEEKLVGAWEFEISPSDDGSLNFSYLELKDDRTGLNGIAHGKGSNIALATIMNQKINNWKVKDDTLIIDITMGGGLFTAPNIKDTLISDFEVTNYWIIEEIQNDFFIAESYDPTIPFGSKCKFLKTKKKK